MKPRVLLDVDGVICDFLTPALETINRLLGTDHKLTDMKSWHLFDSFVASKAVERAAYDEWKSIGWCRNLPVYPGAVEGVTSLREIADVYICTSPMNGETWTNERERWLAHHFGFDRKHVIHTECKWICAADVLIDDKTETLNKWQECHPHGVALRWAQVTNKTVPYDGITVDNWATALRVISFKEKTWKEHRLWTHK